MIRSILILLVLLLVLAVAAVAIGFRRDMHVARSAYGAAGTILDGPDGAIEYIEAGHGSPVLMIHGSGGGFDQGLAFAAPLIDAGHRVIAPSRFGYLGSAMPQGATPQHQADAFAVLLDSLGVGQAVVIGGSAGALSAIQFALRHPARCRALILVVPASYAPDRPPGTNAAPAAWPLVEAALGSDLLFWAAIRAAPGFMTRMVLATEPSLVDAAAPAERARVRDMLLHILPVSRRREGLLMDMAAAGDPPPYPLAAIPCPVLAISAEDDLYGTAAAARHIAATVPGARAQIYGDGGHMLVGHHTEAWSAIEAFIADHGGTEPANRPSMPPPPRPEAQTP